MLDIPFQNLGRLHGSIRSEIDQAISGVVDRNSFVGAASCSQFEAAFASAHGASSAVGCGSGTDALALALRGLGIGEGDEVIVPAMTFVATAEAVVHVGATPVIVDCNRSDLLLNPELVDRATSERTRAVLPVHLFGSPVDRNHILGWKSSGLTVIEDAAQAHLATYEGLPVGSASDAACFSFYPGKNLGAFGDGGAIVTNDEDLAQTLSMLRDHGRADKYSHSQIGFCSRLDGIQAAVLNVKLRHLAGWTESRRTLFAAYQTRLGELVIPAPEGAVHHLMVIRVSPTKRDSIMSSLRQRGIGCGIHYPIPLNEQPSLKPWHASCPEASEAARSIISLPMDPLMSIDEVGVVCDVVEELVD